MRFHDLLHIFDRTILTEANVYNVDVSYNGFSLSKFLKPYLANVGEASQKALQKKLARLLMNNEKFLKPVTKLPDDAPDWAKAALQQGQLMYFQPNDELEGAVEHISHYVAALEQDEKSTDPNKKAIATRELAGVAKAETLELLVTKSNEYFARGTKKTAATLEGTTHIFDGANGYSWYRLDTLEAYKREGKVLQNCIGTHWVPSKADRIYVMKSNNGDTNVAIRTDVNNTIQEVKGKNNKPPVARYMPPVAELINHMKWKVQGNGASDIARAGYMFHEGVLYSRADAIEKFVARKTVITGDGYTIDELSAPKMDKQTRAHLLNYSMYDEVAHVYSFVQGGSPLITANVSAGGELKQIRPVMGELEVNDRKNSPVLKFIRELMHSGRVRSFGYEAQNFLKHRAGVSYDELKKDFRNIGSVRELKDIDTPDHRRELSPEDTAAMREAISDWISEDLRKSNPAWLRDVKTAHINVLKGTFTRGYGDNEDRHTPVQVALVNSEGKATLLTISVGQRSHEITVERGGFGMRPDPERYYNKKRDDTTAESWVAMANEKGFELPTTFLISNGIVKQDEKYVPIRLSELKSDQKSDGSQVFDLSKYEGVDRLTAMMSVAQKLSGSSSSQFLTNLTGFVKSMMSNRYYYGDLPDEPGMMTPAQIERWIGKTFAGKVPDRVVRTKLDVEGGGDQNVTLFITGNRVVRIGDSYGKRQATDAAAHEALARAFNKLAKDLNVVFDPRAMSDHELALIDGTVETEHSVRAKEIEAEYSKTPFRSVRFEDGTEIKRMPGRDFVDMVSVGMGKVSGGIGGLERGARAFEIEKDGQTVGAFTVNAANVFQQLYGFNKKRYKGDYKPPKPKHLSGRDMPNQSTKDSELMKYISSAATKLGYTLKSPEDVPIAKPLGTAHKLLRALAAAPEPLARTQAYKVAGAAATMNGWETLPTPQDRRLYDAGFIAMSKTGKSYMLSITQRGREALKQLAAKNAVRLTPAYKSVRVLGDTEEYQRPQAAAAAPAAAARPAAAPAARAAAPAGDAGGGTKAERAQRLWDAAVAAGAVPTRAEFIRKLVDQVGMTPAGAGTYYHNIKTKHARAQGQVAETFTFLDFLMYIDG